MQQIEHGGGRETVSKESGHKHNQKHVIKHNKIDYQFNRENNQI